MLLTCLSSCKTVLLPKSARNRIFIWNDNALICYVRMLIIACCMQISPRKRNLSGRLWKFMWQRVPKEDTVLFFSHLMAAQCLSVCWRINSYKKQLNNIKQIIILILCILQKSSLSSFINIFRIIKGRPSKYSPKSYPAVQTCRLDKVLWNSFVRIFGSL